MGIDALPRIVLRLIARCPCSRRSDMVMRRRFRFLVTLVLIVAGAALSMQPLVLPSRISAVGPPGDQGIHIPLRWCAMRGTTAENNPGFFGEPDTDSVLWRRHERASDRIWIKYANITFRSAFTATVMASTNFPLIDDPIPPAAGGPGLIADILDPDIDATEYFLAVFSCRTAWNGLGAPPGPIAVNIGRYVDSSGNPTSKWGYGDFTNVSPASANLCATPSGAAVATDGSIAVVDFSITGSADLDARLVAHELGHVLNLHHGNGLDDDSDVVYDEMCDPSETSNTPPSLMHPVVPSGSDKITPRQRGTSRDIALVYTGNQIDPPAALVNGETISDERTDFLRDVGADSVDMTHVVMAVNTNRELVTFTHSLFGLVNPDETNEYLAFADLDANPLSGGSPEALGFPTKFEGAELVTRVVVEPGRRASPTVWRFENGKFVDVTDKNVQAQIVSPTGDEAPKPFFDVVTIEMSLGITGRIGSKVRIQAIARQLIKEGDLDVLPGAAGEWPSDASVDLSMIPPDFAACGLTPAQVNPGDTVTLEATGFRRPNQAVHIVLGDQLIANADLDDAGNLKTDIVIPADAVQGPRLITVGIDKTALTADCTLQVGKMQPQEAAEEQPEATEIVAIGTSAAPPGAGTPETSST
jgi:hypothetical protein